MQWEVIHAEIKVHTLEFDRIYKCLKKKKVPKDNTRDKHINSIITAFNDIKTIILIHYDNLELQQQQFSLSLVTPLRDKLIKLFKHLHLHIVVPVALENLVNKTLVDDSESEDEDEMVQSATDILRLAAQTINKNFSGDPLALNAFVNSVELLERVTEAVNIDILKQG